MLSKIVAFLIAFVIIFTTLIAGLNGFALKTQQEQRIQNLNQEFEVQNRFVASDLLSYTNYNYSVIYYSDSKFIDLENTDDSLEIWWADETGYGDLFEVRHTNLGIFGLYTEWHCLLWKYRNGTSTGVPNYSTKYATAGVQKEKVVANYNATLKSSPFYVSCDHYSASIVLQPRFNNETIEQSWVLHRLNYTISFQFNINSTGLNAFTMLSMIIGFTNPDLGVGGEFGSLLNILIAGMLWGMRIYLFFEIIRRMIPFLPSGGE